MSNKNKFWVYYAVKINMSSFAGGLFYSVVMALLSLDKNRSFIQSAMDYSLFTVVMLLFAISVKGNTACNFLVPMSLQFGNTRKETLKGLHIYDLTNFVVSSVLLNLVVITRYFISTKIYLFEGDYAILSLILYTEAAVTMMISISQIGMWLKWRYHRIGTIIYAVICFGILMAGLMLLIINADEWHAFMVSPAIIMFGAVIILAGVVLYICFIPVIKKIMGQIEAV